MAPDKALVRVDQEIILLIHLRARYQVALGAEVPSATSQYEGEPVIHRWHCWGHTAAEQPRAHHHVIDQACVEFLRASTDFVLNDSIPKILAHQEIQPLRPYCDTIVKVLLWKF
ncbi:hypothetical protein PC114_g20763 [Phytophthora cactorum]|nr:hypothetical protein PC114_g20763 [Phytophthora cactorum]